MNIVFIRHGEPDYSYVTRRGFIGHGRDLAQLSAAGKEQALAVAADARLDGIELIASSPYTRALQTAAIISGYRNIPIEIELDLHEWLPDLTYTFSTEEEAVQAAIMCTMHKGVCPADSPIKYEELLTVFERANACLQKYLGRAKIAVVTHGILMRQFSFAEKIPFCGIREIEFDENYRWCGVAKRE